MRIVNNRRNIDATSPEEVLKKIAPLTGIRRHKVLDIRRRIAEGIYPDAQRRCGPRRAGAAAQRPSGPGGGQRGGSLGWGGVRKLQ